MPRGYTRPRTLTRGGHVGLAVLTVAVMSCSSAGTEVGTGQSDSPTSSSAAASTTSPAQQRQCPNVSPVQIGSPPAWLVGGPTGLPYVVGDAGELVAFIFKPHLRAGSPAASEERNKILWYVREGGPKGTLKIRAESPGSAAAPITTEWTSTDEAAYPSTLDVPSAGCWQLTAQWASREDTIRIEYR